jgi:hypothetical protein
MYTNGVSVLSPAIPGGPHFGKENGLAEAKPLVLLCCFVFLVEHIQDADLERRRNQWRSVDVDGGLSGFIPRDDRLRLAYEIAKFGLRESEREAGVFQIIAWSGHGCGICQIHICPSSICF